MNIAIRDITL